MISLHTLEVREKKNLEITKMKLEKNKAFSAIALILMLTITATLMTYPQNVHAAYVPGENIPTYGFLSVAPNPVGVGQTAAITFWIDKVPPSASGPQGARWSGFTVTITKPDGNTLNLGPFTSDPIGGSYTEYVPTATGTYYVQFAFAGQKLTGVDFFGLPVDNYFEPCTSPKITLVVQQQQIAPLPAVPLPGPTDFWQRPINLENRWGSISGDWLGSTAAYFGLNSYNESGWFNPYTTAPNSAHIVWTKPVAFGGVVGGQFGDIGYYTGQLYEPKFTPALIMNGRLYYNTPDAPRYGFYCVDLRTGETIWWQNSTGKPTITGFDDPALPMITNGQEYLYDSPNQHGVIPYLWYIGSPEYQMYDAFTGNWILTLNNAMSGTVLTSAQGDLLVYVLDGANNWLAMWNSSYIPEMLFSPTGTGAWQWRPPLGATLDWSKGVQWNVTIPSYPGQAISKVGSGVILATTGTLLEPQDWQMEIGYSATTGQKMWEQNRTTPTGSTAYALQGPMSNGVYTEFHLSTMTWYCYSAFTGELLWGPTEPYANPWGSFMDLTCAIAYGNLYATGIDGVLHCFDMKTGKHLWDSQAWNSGIETPYGNYPNTPIGTYALADGKFFACNSEHSPNQPLYRGYRIHAISTTDGHDVWNVLGWYQNPVIADGYMVTLNGADNQLYCFGKGQTATTVSTPDTAVPQGTSVVIKGTVTDQSPGAKGTPAISDASMSQWMEYLYMQQPIPTNATGVPVTLTAIDPSGNNVAITTVNTDATGHYSYLWTPPSKGLYTITATFCGTNSYFTSSAETSLGVDGTSGGATGGTGLSTDSLSWYIIGAAVAVIIAIVIVGILVLRKRS